MALVYKKKNGNLARISAQNIFSHSTVTPVTGLFMWSMNHLIAKLIFSKCGPNKETFLESKNYSQRRKKT